MNIYIIVINVVLVFKQAYVYDLDIEIYHFGHYLTIVQKYQKRKTNSFHDGRDHQQKEKKVWLQKLCQEIVQNLKQKEFKKLENFNDYDN